MGRLWRVGLLGLLLMAVPVKVVASPIIINFDGLADLDIVSNQFAGLTFTNTQVLAAGLSLNEFEFPPHSGANVVVDNGGAITISFASPVFAFGGYFTYLAPLTLSVFDSSSNLLGATASLFGANLALSGDPGSVPNEFIAFSSGLGIKSVTITGDALGGSFTMDDATVTPFAQTTAVPEPGTLVLALLGSVLLAIRFRSRSTSNRGA